MFPIYHSIYGSKHPMSIGSSPQMLLSPSSALFMSGSGPPPSSLMMSASNGYASSPEAHPGSKAIKEEPLTHLKQMLAPHFSLTASSLQRPGRSPTKSEESASGRNEPKEEPRDLKREDLAEDAIHEDHHDHRIKSETCEDILRSSAAAITKAAAVPFLKFSVNAILAKAAKHDPNCQTEDLLPLFVPNASNHNHAAQGLKDSIVISQANVFSHIPVSSLPSNFHEHHHSSPPPSSMVSSPSLNHPRSPSDPLYSSPLIMPAKPVPSRPLPMGSHPAPSGPQQLFSSHLQSLLYRHQYLSGVGSPGLGPNGSSLGNGLGTLGPNSSITLPGSGTTVFPLPGSFPWAAGARGKPRRGMLRRAVFSDYQRKGLEKRFQMQKYISKPDRKKLAEKLGLKDSQPLGRVIVVGGIGDKEGQQVFGLAIGVVLGSLGQNGIHTELEERHSRGLGDGRGTGPEDVLARLGFDPMIVVVLVDGVLGEILSLEVPGLLFGLIPTRC
eukprot:snap_masked-scaffold143_size313727-processed-gene-2.4 protein:Tk09423 transcript:snap_masked-scaffold143_size313727-processed-gene-2.4-mRNA-1 annotation:"---NA---"